MGYFDLSPSDSARDLRRSTVLMLEKMSIPIEYTFHSSAMRAPLIASGLPAIPESACAACSIAPRSSATS